MIHDVGLHYSMFMEEFGGRSDLLESSHHACMRFLVDHGRVVFQDKKEQDNLTQMLAVGRFGHLGSIGFLWSEILQHFGSSLPVRYVGDDAPLAFSSSRDLERRTPRWKHLIVGSSLTQASTTLARSRTVCPIEALGHLSATQGVRQRAPRFRRDFPFDAFMNSFLKPLVRESRVTIDSRVSLCFFDRYLGERPRALARILQSFQQDCEAVIPFREVRVFCAMEPDRANSWQKVCEELVHQRRITSVMEVRSLLPPPKKSPPSQPERFWDRKEHDRFIRVGTNRMVEVSGGLDSVLGHARDYTVIYRGPSEGADFKELGGRQAGGNAVTLLNGSIARMSQLKPCCAAS